MVVSGRSGELGCAPAVLMCTKWTRVHAALFIWSLCLLTRGGLRSMGLQASWESIRQTGDIKHAIKRIGKARELLETYSKKPELCYSYS